MSRSKEIYTNFPGYKPFSVRLKLIPSGNDDKAAFGILVAAAEAMFEVIPKALLGFFNTLVANF